MTTLEEEIERLSQMRACSRSRVRSRSQDCQRSRERRRKRGCCQVSQPADPETSSGDEESKGRDADLGEPQELAPTVASFLWGLQRHQTMRAGRCHQSPLFWILPNGSSGRWESVTPPAGGWNYPLFQGKTTLVNLPGKLGHLLDCCGSYEN